MAKMSLSEPESKKSILKPAKKGGKSPGKKKKVRLEVSYDGRGTERKKEATPLGRSRGRQSASQGQRAGADSSGGAKPKYTAPTTMKGRRLKREQEEKVRDSSETLEQKLANEKHTIKSYYDLDTPSAAKRGSTGLRNPDAKTLDELGATQFDKERVEELAAPVNR
jgi:hypothetical protein